MNEHSMHDIYQLRDEKQAKAYLHPVRMRILQFLTPEAMTISQVAGKLGVHPANLTHHFRKLSETHLIKLVEERDTGRVVEKYYRSIARSFQLRDENVSMQGAGQQALAILQQDMQVAVAQLSPEAKDLICFLANVRIPKRTFTRFQKRLERLVEQFRKEEEKEVAGALKTSDNLYYSLNISLYPRQPEISSADIDQDCSS